MSTKPKLADLCWAAGILDGEGCIYVVIDNRGRGRVDLRLRVGNTDARMPVEFQRIFGCGGVYTQKVSEPAHKSFWIWTVAGNQRIGEILSWLRPYLVVKGEQADIAIQLANTYGAGKNPIPVPDSVRAYRRDLAKQLKYLKKHPVTLDQLQAGDI